MIIDPDKTQSIEFEISVSGNPSSIKSRLAFSYGAYSTFIDGVCESSKVSFSIPKGFVTDAVPWMLEIIIDAEKYILAASGIVDLEVKTQAVVVHTKPKTVSVKIIEPKSAPTKISDDKDFFDLDMTFR